MERKPTTRQPIRVTSGYPAQKPSARRAALLRTIDNERREIADAALRGALVNLIDAHRLHIAHTLGRARRRTR